MAALASCVVCPVGPYAPVPLGSYDATVDVDVLAPGYPLNRNLLGTGVEWQNRGDGLMTEEGEFDEKKIGKALQQGFTVFHYPGGTLQDTYHFEAGLGPQSSRGKCQNLYPGKQTETVRLGTMEALMIAQRAGATTLFGTNVVTGTAAEAAAWVKLTNVDGVKDPQGNTLPHVQFWEVGNEPYLKNDSDKSLNLEPEDFGARAGEQIRAMRAVDPTITVGIPVRTDLLGGVPVTPYADFNRRMFSTMAEEVDFVALHTAYGPLITEVQCHLPTTLATGTLALYLTVEEDMQATRDFLATVRPGRSIGLAFTEYSPLFTFLRGFSDLTMLSHLGALLLADLLVTFANHPDVVMANHWSLLGNGLFGGVSDQGVVRPSHVVLKGLGQAFHGQVAPHRVEGPTFEAGRVGFSPHRDTVPTLHALTLVDGHTLRLVLINKDLHRKARVQVNANATLSPREVRTRVLNAPNLLGVNEFKEWLHWEDETQPGGTLVEVPPHAVMVVELDNALP
jgi:alpha-N-arabinofuranosidase